MFPFFLIPLTKSALINYSCCMRLGIYNGGIDRKLEALIFTGSPRYVTAIHFLDFIE